MTHDPRAAARRGMYVMLAMLVMAMPCTAGAQTPFPVADWLSDFSQLKRALSQQYSNLDWAVERRGILLDALSRQTESVLKSATSETAARTAIESFLHAFGDGHLEVRWPSATASPSDKESETHRSVCERLGYARARRGGGIRFEFLPDFRWFDSPDSVYFRAGLLTIGGERIGVLRIEPSRRTLTRSSVRMQFEVSASPRMPCAPRSVRTAWGGRPPTDSPPSSSAASHS